MDAGALLEGTVTDAVIRDRVGGLANVPATPPIRIEIDQAVTGGQVHDRFDIMLRGRAVSVAPIEEVRLQVGDLVVGTASYGLPEQAAPGILPDGRAARQRVFHFSLPRPAGPRQEGVGLQIVARTEDGCEFTEHFTLSVDRHLEHPVSVVSGPTDAGILGGAVRPHVVMYIEQGSLTADGFLTVHGWAVSLGPVLAVQIFAGEKRMSKALLGEEREDVAAAFTDYPNALLSGFTVSAQLEPPRLGIDAIRVQIICADGFGQEGTVPVQHLRQGLAPARSLSIPRRLASPRPEAALAQAPLAEGFPRTPGSPAAAASAPAAQQVSAEIRMFCDTANLSSDGTVFINGWAVSAAGIAQVRVLVDDAEIGLAAIGHQRLDVAGAFPDIPMSALSGFKLQQKTGRPFQGEHSVRVIVRNARDEEAEQKLTAAGAAGALRLAAGGRAAPPVPPAPEPASAQADEFRFELDAPALANGVVVEPVSGRLTIEGWLLTRSGVASFEVFLDGQYLGDAHHGLARQDVGAAFPDWPNALRSGYAFHCPPRALRDGEHAVRLAIKSNSGVPLDRTFRLTVRKSEDQQEQLGIRRRVPQVETDMMSALLAEMNYRPAFRFILRQDRSIDIDRLRRLFDALRLQTYDAWSMLILAEDDGVAAAMQLISETIPDLAARLAIISPTLAEAWLSPLARGGDGRDVLNMLLLAGDELGADALFELAVAGGRNPAAGLVYGDEVRLSPASLEKEPFFKPDFSPDLLAATNYLGRPWAVASETLAKTAATPASLTAGGEYDLALRCVEVAGGVHHVPKLLCQRGGMALDEPTREKAALQAMLARRGIAGDVLATPVPGTWRLRRAVATQAMVSIIIPTCAANGYIESCITSLREKTAYKNYEIIVIDNIPASDAGWKDWVASNADKVVGIPDAFNWSVFNNRAAEVAEGEFLLFLNDDITITQGDWLDALLEHGERPEVGITGPQLLYPDGKVQHAGMFLSSNGLGRHAFRFAAHDDPCYFGLALTQRNVIAVTGACMLVRKAVFDRLGRFDEAHQIVNNDLDFCLRAHRAGLLTVFTPYATMIHHELASRAKMRDVFDLTHFNAAWKTVFAAGDPYFNPRLSRHADDFRPDEEAVQPVVSGTPLFHASDIRRILVVKLDHIGDFVTALAPIRRLKSLFPRASITLLAGPGLRSFVALEPSIDAFMPFAFFHARSQLGERQLGKDDFAALAEKLRPHRFDLAVDLRKHPSTRDVLKHSGARFLAGFDHLGQYPYLDVALDWDGDRTLQRKRSHIVVDLLSLVNAIGQATESPGVVMQPGPAPMPLDEMPDDVRALFNKPVVAVHPGAGNVTKQWPEEHFSALIDLLIERNGVNVMLIGGPDEADIADRLRRNALRPEAVASMAGKTSLADLPRLLRNCALYIGNDSGPKHIAAAAGIATIGVHSGVVDPVEWGPIGPNAVALRRNMTCSPCYLANAEDCPRSLACLRFLEPSLVYETADLMLGRPVPAHGATMLPAAEALKPHVGKPRPLRKPKPGRRPQIAKSA